MTSPPRCPRSPWRPSR
uniref:Uncharacterized protein n=1 Tax=Arundo donax TaxID=35708 RepID=A0A0A8YVV7_ARUDO